MWGLFATVRALRGEEDAGRYELVLAGWMTRKRAFGASLLAIMIAGTLIWLAMAVALIAVGLAFWQSLELALATMAPGFVFVGVAAVASQVFPTRRLALAVAGGLLGVMLLLRVAADTSSSLEALRWVTPLGWSEEVKAFSADRPLVLLLPLATTVLLIVVAAALAQRRDVAIGLISVRDEAPPKYRWLQSTTRAAIRRERASIIAWASGAAIFAFVLGVLAKSISSLEHARAGRDAQSSSEFFAGNIVVSRRRFARIWDRSAGCCGANLLFGWVFVYLAARRRATQPAKLATRNLTISPHRADSGAAFSRYRGCHNGGNRDRRSADRHLRFSSSRFSGSLESD